MDDFFFTQNLDEIIQMDEQTKINKCWHVWIGAEHVPRFEIWGKK
jgi:hypothetical protein